MNLHEFISNFVWNMTYDDRSNFDKEKARYAIYAVMALNEKLFDGYSVDEVLDDIQEKIWRMQGED